jgi:hypothetical protein
MIKAIIFTLDDGTELFIAYNDAIKLYKELKELFQHSVSTSTLRETR